MREHCRQVNISVEISRPHDFAVRAHTFVLRRQRVHPIPPPTSVTIAIRPYCEAGWREVLEMICPTTKAKYFRAHDWTVDSGLIGLTKLDFWRNLPILRTASFRFCPYDPST